MKRTALAFALVLALSLSAVAEAVEAPSATENSWTTKAPMHQARIFLGAAVVNGKIYAIGGIDDNGPTAINEEYDPATDTWTYKTPMPTPRYFFGIAVCQNKIYCIGGKGDGYSAIAVNEVYDPAKDTWQTLKPAPTARMNLQASVVNGKIYLMGGRVSDFPDYNSTIFNLNEVYDPLIDTWTTKTPMPQAASGIASAVVDNKIYVMTPTVNMIYDPQTDSWSQGAPPLASKLK
jgi:N-acetylneuraminic acid mutarotase